jgi:hypothetical protein
VKATLVFVGLLMLTTVVAQQSDEPHPDRAIYGTAIAQDGWPAENISLTASPLGVVLATVLPHTRTNEKGEYRFESLPWWGRYTVYAEDEDAGYSLFSTGSGYSEPSEVKLTPQQQEGELKIYLPPKAGFVRIDLTNRRTAARISGMRVAVMATERPESPLFTTSCYSDRVILVPPQKNLLLHVSSDGFREWDESVGRGRPINLPSGTRLRLAVELDPSD